MTIFTSLEFALMLSGEVRKNRWSVFTDVIYMDFSGEKSSVKAVDFGGNRVSASANVSTDFSLTGLVLDTWHWLCRPAWSARNARCLRRAALL